jgi:hypothetical protein
MRWFKPRERTVAIIGYPNHGKTVFLAGLFWDSFFALSESFEDERSPYAVRAANARAAEVFFGNAIMLSRSQLPPSSPRTPPEPAVLEFSGVPGADGKRRKARVVFYDIPGEAVSDEEWLLNHAPFLPRTDDLVFIFDPTRADFAERALQAADLRDKIFRIVPGGERKNFIVVLSKMDELRDENEWARMIAEYWPDDSPRPERVGAYHQEMERLSRMIRQWWTDQAHGGRGFVNQMPASTRYCAISSLGCQPAWRCASCEVPQADSLQVCGECGSPRPRGAALMLVTRPRPFRVRDPLFWVFRSMGVM